MSFEYLTAKDGLPQSTIRGIVKDKYGFMWFGTWNGLCRYDGYSFKIYRTIPGDTSSIASNRIHYLHKDSEGTIWVSVFNQIVCRYNYNTDDFTRYKLADIPLPFRDSVNRQRDMIALQNASDFLRSVIGPFHLAGTKESIVFETPVGVQGSLSDNNVNCMYRDEAGILWIGTANGGINKADLNAGKFQSVPVYADQHKILYMAIRSMWVDEKGVWLGTEDGGLYYIDHQMQAPHKVSERLAGENIKAVLKDKNGNVWIGKRSGLDKYNPQTGQITSYFKTSVSSSESRFYAIAEDPVTHDLWFSYYNGILKYNPDSRVFEKQPLESYGRSGAGCLFFDSKNNLWIGTEYSGLIQLKRDPKNNTWTDTVVYTSVASDKRSPDERVYAVVEDSEGSIWVGAANGLTRINPKTQAVKTYTVKDGLVDHYITQVMAQPGYIWFAHKNGLSKFNIKTGQIQNYAVKKPGQDFEFMDGSGFFDRSTGQMYYGTTKGFIHFNPQEIADNPFLPVTAFTALQVLNKTVNVGDTINGRVMLPMPLHMAPSITLTHEDKSFSIEFAALHYSNPARNQYAYMLVGQDKDWIYTDASRRIASYSNLSPGKYVMMVKASNSDGVWNPMPATLEIIVLPPWWKTWWAYTIYTLLLIASGYGLFRIVQVRQQYHREILTERLKAEKAQELDQLKSSFFTNVSHEFRTPLTLIIDPLRSLLANNNAAEKEKLHYNVMYRNAQRLLTLINQFLDFRKLESGKMKLSPQRQDIVAFVKNTAAAFDYKAQEQHIHFSIKATPQQIMIGFDADVAGKVLYNLISNAFKFTPPEGSIEVRIIAENEIPDEVILSVTDSGRGIPADKIDKVFEPFFQVEGEGQHAGSGVGLSLTKELVELHKGKITVTSRPGIATCFMVHLSNLEAGSRQAGNHSAWLNNKPEPSMPFVPADKESSAALPIVLVVEDNDDIRNYIRQGLSPFYSVLEAAHGAEGFDKATVSIPDLIVSDVMMPVMDGLELCKKLKTDEKTSHIPVILLTARQSDQYESESYETGVDAYVVKPFNMSLLLVRIRSLIEGRTRLRQLFSQSPESYSNPVGLSTADKAFLAKATRLVEDHMSDGDVNVEWLAGRLFMSRTQLYRKVKAVTNQSVHEFVTGIRLHKAAGLLLQGQHSVTDIAFMVGYADATSFSRMFQKQYGTTPKKYSQAGDAS
ncbi:two-component regulator propeller domain-containing protein [Niabella aquatica]